MKHDRLCVSSAPLALTAALAVFPLTAGAQTATFRVDMSVQESIGRFDPSLDLLDVRGPFNSWTGTPMDLMAGSTSVYEAVVEIFDAPGTAIEYKFFFNDGTDVWETGVGPGTNGNRLFTYVDGGQVLDTVFFDNLDTDPGAGVEVTFQVDMSVLIEDGFFLPELDFVEALGTFNNWTGGFELAPAAPGSAVYTGTTTINSIAPGGTVEHKFRYNGSAWEEAIGNRTFVLADTGPQVLPAVYFNDAGPGSTLEADTGILFTVDMDGAMTTGGLPFDPASDTLYINGLIAANTWWGWDSPPFGSELFDDGSPDSGDAVAGDGVYSIRFEAYAGDLKRVEYKYSVNGSDNEAGFQDNHVRYIRSTGTYAFPTDAFGDMVREPETLPADPGPIAISPPSGGMVTVSWDNPDALLERSGAMGSGSWAPVPGSEDVTEMSFPTDDPAQGYFRLTLP